MKCISVWQPYASLLVKGLKVFETRSWPAPQSVIGTRIGIASTKRINAVQLNGFEDENFQVFYNDLNMPSLIELPHGFLLGTVILDSVELMTPEFMDDVSGEEKAYGWWDEGRYAWRTTDPVEFDRPIIIGGKQGIYDWQGTLPDARTPKDEHVQCGSPG